MKTVRVLLILIIFVGCLSNRGDKQDNLILYANREAPLGWLYLKLYNDGKFDFVSKGLRDETVYPGTYRFNPDTIFLAFKDTMPKAADDTLIINESVLSYQNGHGGLSISINKLLK